MDNDISTTRFYGLTPSSLVSIASYDGKTGFAICQGRTWAGNQISVVYMFPNTAGAWSGSTVTRSERK